VPTDEPAPTPPQAASSSGERRQVTVLFADTVGFTAISEKLGEEGTYALVQPIYELMAGAVHHYGQTNRAGKAFTYLAMAGAKVLGVYSLDEADNYFAAAIALLDHSPDCASDQQVAGLLAGYTFYSNMSLRLKSLTEIVERFMSRLNRLGDNHMCLLVNHQYVLALLWSARYREAQAVQISLSAMASRLLDAKSRAYALASAIHVSTLSAPYAVEKFESLSREAITAASDLNDAYLQTVIRFTSGWEEFHRGRTAKAHDAAEEGMAVGRRMNDPRSIGFGMVIQAWVALTSDDYVAALNFAETGISIARTPWDREGAKNARTFALVLLRRPGVFQMLRDWMDQCSVNGWHLYLAGADGIWGIALVVQGEIREGIRWMEQSILRRENEGYRTVADWYRLFLCEIYLEIIAGSEKPSVKVLARIMLTLVAVMFTAQRRICALVERVRQNPHFDPNGHLSVDAR
jgi:hypothetical protein